MTISLEEAAEVLREAMRENVRQHSLWYFIQGVLMILAGVFALIFPLIAAITVVVLLGWLLVISGIVQGVGLLGSRAVPHFWLQAITVGLCIVLGVTFLSRPGEGLLTITLLLVVFFLIGGLSRLIFALTIKPFPNWGWVLASGIVNILLALWLWASFPVSAAWFLSLLLGIQLVSEGAAIGYMAWRERQGQQVAQ